METPDQPEPHPGDPWHPAWEPDTPDEMPGEMSQAAEAAGRIQREVDELAARAGDQELSEGFEIGRRWRDDVAAAREQEAARAAEAATGVQGADTEPVPPVLATSVPESGRASSRSWLRRRGWRSADAESVVTPEEEDSRQVDDRNRSEGDVPDHADGDESWVEEPTRATDPDEAVYAALASDGADEDEDFPWDDEDWTGASTGDDVSHAPLDLIAEPGDEAAESEPETGAEPAAPEDGVDDGEPGSEAGATAEVPDLLASAEDEPDDEAPGAVQPEATRPEAEQAPTTASTIELEAPVKAEAPVDEMDSHDEEEGRFSHAEVIPLVRPDETAEPDEEEASAGIDPDLVAVAGETWESAEPINDEAADDDAAPDGDDADDGSLPEDSEDDGESEDDFAGFTLEDYTGTATEEYAELARAVAASEEEQHELVAVSAEMPGLDTSLVGLDDVVDAGIAVTETISTTRRSDLGLRVATGIGLLVVFAGSLLWGWAIGALILVVLGIAALELYIVAVNSGYRPLTWAGLVGVIGALAGTWVWGVVAIPIALGLTFIGSTLFLALATERRTPLADLALTVTTMAWIGVLGAPAFAIIESPDFRWLILAIVITTAVMDVAQYFFGRWLGRRPLAPVVSPKKTVEGLVGGIFAALLVGVAFGSIEASPFDPGSGLAFGAMVAVVAPFGDLAVSVVKRALAVKDMGAILPGHGGVLDRIDAMVFVIPSAWILYRSFDMLG